MELFIGKLENLLDFARFTEINDFYFEICSYTLRIFVCSTWSLMSEKWVSLVCRKGLQWREGKRWNGCNDASKCEQTSKCLNYVSGLSHFCQRRWKRHKPCGLFKDLFILVFPKLFTYRILYKSANQNCVIEIKKQNPSLSLFLYRCIVIYSFIYSIYCSACLL